MAPFQAIKTVLVEQTHLAKDALHIYVALGVFLGSCLVFGWKARQWRPWLLVLVIALIGEVIDVIDSIRDNDPVRPHANIKDLWNTMLAPTALMLLARFSTVFEAPAPSGDEAEIADPPAHAEGDVGEPRD